MKIVIAICCALALTACAGKSKNKEPKVDGQQPAELFELALTALDNKNYLQAVAILESLDQQFPFESFSAQAQLELIYAHFKNRDYVAANAGIDRFMRLRNGHPNMDYVYYLRGLVSYYEDTPLVGSLVAVDVTHRGLGSAQDAIAHFSEFIERFPDSQFVEDAKLRIQFLRNLYARKEINIANFYLKREAYISAISRAKYVIENYQKSPAVPDGFAILYMSYRVLGFDVLADEILEVLQLNYPSHPILKVVGSKNEVTKLRNIAKQTNSRLNVMTLGILNPPPPAVDTRHIFNNQYQLKK